MGSSFGRWRCRVFLLNVPVPDEEVQFQVVPVPAAKSGASVPDSVPGGSVLLYWKLEQEKGRRLRRVAQVERDAHRRQQTFL